ncbi:hypothetical protein SeMB42_g07368 [Synchytrium endobioticum]|uniref:Uncharacterized protein n=1 Tax=Synchytrium endobioticum TaxID=286115 RepID=A0A507BXS4_9FUNG|nr:hypothetical protein SeMB42_g07368 [Synchytrium endobioticum]TPX42027.1 hypothetical protein SeLEV6574_g05810 [Synchytrium endobioticum]
MFLTVTFVVLLICILGVHAPGCYSGKCFRIVNNHPCYTGPDGINIQHCTCASNAFQCESDSRNLATPPCIWNWPCIQDIHIRNLDVLSSGAQAKPGDES